MHVCGGEGGGRGGGGGIGEGVGGEMGVRVGKEWMQESKPGLEVPHAQRLGFSHMRTLASHIDPS
jgi:hypothetical protein